jgi:hypothetical protein
MDSLPRNLMDYIRSDQGRGQEHGQANQSRWRGRGGDTVQQYTYRCTGDCKQKAGKEERANQLLRYEVKW